MESVTGFAKGEGATYSYTGAITNAGTVQSIFTYTLNEAPRPATIRLTTLSTALLR